MIIGRLRGTVAALGSDSVMVDVNGVGYVALAGSRLLSKLTVGAEAEVFIETRVTESSITLFAFGSDDERAWFVRLQDVPGVAGKSAMAIMDAISATELMDALALGDTAVDHPQGAPIDQRLEAPHQQRSQVGIQRVHLEQHHLVLHEELVEQVHRADGGYVARSQHQAHASLHRVSL